MAGLDPVHVAPGTRAAIDARTGGDGALTVRVAARSAVADGVVELWLEDPDGGALPAWEPGAHVDLVLRDGLVRQYSLCSDPGDPSRWRVAVLREPDGRGGSAYVHDALHAGTTLEVRGPRNHFPLEDAERYVFVAGGIGITPILPMIRRVEAAGRPWTLTYGGRTAGTMAFVDELAPHGDRVRTRPADVHGLLDLAEVVGTPRAGTAIYCCGPEPLLQAVEAQTADWPRGALHVERFAAKAVAADPAADGTFEVECPDAGVTVTVGPGESILEVLEDHGIDVLCSCTEGVCGTCETGVLSGEPDHRDSVLTEDQRAAGQSMMICVSRSRSARLVLDL